MANELTTEEIEAFAVRYGITAEQIRVLSDRVGSDRAALEEALVTSERKADPVNQPSGGAYR